MDLYEALKAGTSAEDLKKTFEKDLDLALTRFAADKEAKEREAAKQADIEAARNDLVDALATYTGLLCDEDFNDSASRTRLEAFLKDLEQEMSNVFTLLGLNETKKSKPTEKKPAIKDPNAWGFETTIDDKVLRDFLKNL